MVRGRPPSELVPGYLVGGGTDPEEKGRKLSIFSKLSEELKKICLQWDFPVLDSPLGHLELRKSDK